MRFQAVVLFSTTLLAIVNPIGSAVMFTAVAGRFPTAVQRQMAKQSGLAVAIILLVCAWAGKAILQALGISVAMLQAAGGLILLLSGMRMVSLEESKLTEDETHSAEVVPEAQWKALAVVPLAIPGTVGAGTITTVIVQASTYDSLRDLAIISGVSLIVALIVWIAFVLATPIAQRLGSIGMNIVTRVMGILVVATAFGLLARGIGGLLPGLVR